MGAPLLHLRRRHDLPLLDKKHFYRLDPETGKMTALTGIYGYPTGAASWQDKGYFFRAL